MRRSSGSNTARAVNILAATNAEIRKATNEKASLDDVLRMLASHKGKITVEEFRNLAAEIAGQPVESLKPRKLPGCS
jgi:predicted metalloprotease with PDZ domain